VQSTSLAGEDPIVQRSFFFAVNGMIPSLRKPDFSEM